MAIKEEEGPIDLSDKKTSDISCTLKSPILPKLFINPNLIFSDIVKKKNIQVISNASKGSVFTEAEIAKLLDPYVKSVDKKFSCEVCEIKFRQKAKAVTHVEKKHVDCLQYKCPLCRASKGTRLAYESHLRRGHGANVKDYSPLIRCKKMFSVKSEAQGSKTETPVGQPYDLQFVTFLRHILGVVQNRNTSTSNCHTTIPCAEWIDQDQGIFSINNRHQFSTMWAQFKVITAVCFPHVFIFLYFSEC